MQKIKTFINGVLAEVKRERLCRRIAEEEAVFVWEIYNQRVERSCIGQIRHVRMFKPILTDFVVNIKCPIGRRREIHRKGGALKYWPNHRIHDLEDPRTAAMVRFFNGESLTPLRRELFGPSYHYPLNEAILP